MKTKIAIFITFACILFTASCNDKKSAGTSTERYSTKLDTSYKDNSLEINSISRTFYQLGKWGDNPYIQLSQNVGEKGFTITLHDGKDFTVSIFENDKELNKFFEDMQTVANNPDKTLNFDFGSLKSGSISFNKPDNKIMLYNRGMFKDESSLVYIDKAEIDSMQTCYNKYKSEINK